MSAVILWRAGARFGRETDPFARAVGRRAIVAGPPCLAAVGPAVADRRHAPAYADIARRACRVLKADLSRVAVLLVATLLTLSGTIPILDVMVGDGKAAVEAEHLPGTHGPPHNHLICIQPKGVFPEQRREKI